ncbi:hypothetical protein OG912_35040 [Streptomyces sp. NBC_00464]|uniref:hypothetical protein n=1 Tax=Streptomyces sp. NBC_00464 TaxID=2975751 RepID=UPI002E18AABC
MVIRRMKPLGFTLDETRDLLDATDRVDAGEDLDTRERGGLLEPRTRVQRAAAEQVTRHSASGSPRAEDLAAALRARLPQESPPSSVRS